MDESLANDSEFLEELEALCAEEPIDEVNWPLWMVAGPMSVLLAALSTYGNFVSLRILASLRIRKSVRFYLCVLSSANAALAQCTLWYYAIGEMLKPFLGTIQFFQVLTVVLHPISAFSLTLSVWMVLTVTVDRYFALAKPLQHRAYDSHARAKCFSGSIIFSAILFTIPSAFELRWTRDCDIFLPEGEPSRIRLLPTSLRVSDNYLLLYGLVANAIFISVFPFFLITLLSLRMLFVVYAARALRSNLEATKSSDHKPAGNENTTIMLLTVVVKFLICNSPSMLLNVWEKVAGSTEVASDPVFRWCVELSNLLMVVNSGSDSIVYLRWKKKQGSHLTYTAIPKTFFTQEDADYLRNKYQMQRSALLKIIDATLIKKENGKPVLEPLNIQSTIDIMLQSIGDPQDEMKMISTLKDLGARHHGTSIPPAEWNKFKNAFINEFSGTEDSRLWSRLICILIKEFRDGETRSIQARTRSCNV